MLSEHERRALGEIEHDLRSNDPDLAEVFHTTSAPTESLLFVLALTTAVAMLVVGLFAANGWLIFWGTGAVSALAWMHATKRKAWWRTAEDEPREG